MFGYIFPSLFLDGLFLQFYFEGIKLPYKMLLTKILGRGFWPKLQITENHLKCLQNQESS